MTEIVKVDKEQPQVLSKEVLRKQMKDALKEIDVKLKKLMKGSTTMYKATGNFKLNENDNNNINIQTSIDVGYLIKALAQMIRIKAEYEKTAKELELTTYPICPWMGCTADQWIHDLRLRIGTVTNAATIQGLTVARQKLETFLTEEDRLSITLKEIAALMNK